MDKENIISGIIITLLLVCSFGIYRVNPSFGGLIHNVLESFDEGVAVDGTTVIDGDGNWDGAITGTTATLSSTLAVTGASTLIGNTAVTGTLTTTGETNVSGFVQGGTSYATSTGSALSLTAAQMCDNSYIKVTPSAAINVTTATTSTLIADCIPAIGDRASFYYENGATGAGTTTTMVAGSGIDLIEPSGGDVIIAGNEDAFIEFLNIDGSTVKVFITSLQVAD